MLKTFPARRMAASYSTLSWPVASSSPIRQMYAAGGILPHSGRFLE
jgi:hypothetical protein